MVLDIRCTRDVSIGTLLLARGRDRLETKRLGTSPITLLFLLLARGRDRLETALYSDIFNRIAVSPTR